VLVNHNIPADKPWPFVGTNNFDFGKKAAQAITGNAETGINLAVIYSEKNPAMYAEKELVEMGLSGVLGRQMLSAVTSLKTDTNPQSAEQVIYQLVRTMADTTTVIFTDSEDTLAGTQVIVDLNLVGKIRIVGFGNSPEILEYIRKGIISATIVVDPEQIGYQAIMALVELKEVGYTSNSVDIGIMVIQGE
jgi:ribose transport system substrate-binding protein